MHDGVHRVLQEAHVGNIADRNEDEEQREQKVPIQVENDPRIEDKNHKARKDDARDADRRGVEVQIDDECDSDEGEWDCTLWPHEPNHVVFVDGDRLFWHEGEHHEDEDHRNGEQRKREAHELADSQVIMRVDVQVVRVAKRSKAGAEIGADGDHCHLLEHADFRPFFHHENKRDKRENRHIIGGEHGEKEGEKPHGDGQSAFRLAVTEDFEREPAEDAVTGERLDDHHELEKNSEDMPVDLVCLRAMRE